MKISLMMAMALFPDAASYDYVDAPCVIIQDLGVAEFLDVLRSRDPAGLGKSLPVERIDLEPITESPPWVMAGVWEKRRKVFIYDRAPE